MGLREPPTKTKPDERPPSSPSSPSTSKPSSAPTPALNWLELYAAKRNPTSTPTSSSQPEPTTSSVAPTPPSTTSTSSSLPFFFPTSSRSTTAVEPPVLQNQPAGTPPPIVTLKLKPSSSPSPPSESSKVPLDPRGNVPPSVLEAGQDLHKEILTSWIASQPSPLRIAKRDNLLAFLSKLISSIDSRYSVVPFGSVAVGADGNTSDLDLTIRDAKHPEGFDDPKLFTVKQAPYDMHRLHSILKRSMAELQAVPWARVPVVKFVDPKSGIDVDINCNNLGGLNNSTWLLSYLQISPHALRPLIHAVKKWASTRKINDPAGQEGGTSFSSYTIQLLCLAYLQAPIHRLPSISSTSDSQSSPPTLQPFLPNLQSPSLLARLRIPTTYLHLRDKPPKIHKINTTYAPLSSLPSSEVDLWTQRNQNVDVGELVKGFFRFYAGETAEGWGGNKFDWNTGAVSPLEGGIVRRLNPNDQGVKSVTGSGVGGLWISRAGGQEEKSGLEWCLAEEKGKEGGKESVQLVKWNDAVMVVRDPFEWHKNCTQSINLQTSQRILDEFSRAHVILSTNPKASFLRDVCAEVVGLEGGKISQERNVWN